MSAASQAMASSGRRGGKSAAAFRTISEVATELEVPQHVLRFWETKFSQIRPMKRGGGRRYYRPEDVQLLARIRKLLHDDGYTIRGVQKLLKSGALRLEMAAAEVTGDPTLFDAPRAPTIVPKADGQLDAGKRGELRETLRELKALHDLLAQAVR